MGSFTKWTEEFVCTAQSEKIPPFNAGTERWDAYYNLLMKWFVSLIAILFMRMVAISKLLLRI
jgi:hypothetical protein